jgi:hypothetical protein
MTKKEMAEVLKYASPNELYIITWENKLLRLCCPFTVIAMHEVGELMIGELLFVDEVKVTQDLITVYLIKGKAYFYYHFEIYL